MSAKIIDGRALALKIKDQVKQQAQNIYEKIGRAPSLAVIMVGQDPASATYVRNKRRVSQELGIKALDYDLPEKVSEKKLLKLISELNNQPKVDGILVQLPLPVHIDANKIITSIDPNKDVDGFHPENLGKLLAGQPKFIPCTPAGIMEIIYSVEEQIAGKKAVIIGRSNIVGKPTALLLLQADATVTLCHSRTKDLAQECKAADILVVAVGKRYCILGDWIKPGTIVIDVGINRDAASGLCGDVDFTKACDKAGYITPVPGGVGPMTIAMLMRNTIYAAKIREGLL